MTELAVLPIHGISIYTAHYIFETLCELHAVPRLIFPINKHTGIYKFPIILSIFIWDEVFLPLNFCAIYLKDVQTTCATNKERISQIHDTIQIELGHIFVKHRIRNTLQISVKNSIQKSNVFFQK